MIISTTNTINGKTVTNLPGHCHRLRDGRVPRRRQGHPARMDHRRGGSAQGNVSQASALGADAILGVKINAHKSGIGDYLYITGTAVKLG